MAKRDRYKMITFFTIIELLVVIAVIIILVSLLLPGLKKARDMGKRISCSSSGKQLALSTGMYLNDYGGWYPCYVFPLTGGYKNYDWCEFFVRDGYVKGGRTQYSGMWVDTGLHCPSREPDDVKTDTWSDYVISLWSSGYGGVCTTSRGQKDSDVKAPSMLALFAESWNQFLRYPPSGRGLDSLCVAGSGQMPIANTSAAPANAVAVSPWTHDRGSNYAMCDGSVRYIKAGDLRFNIFNINGQYPTIGVDLTRMAE